MTTIIDTLVDALGRCDIVDLSRGVTDHAAGPFQTRIEPLEPEPGAQFFLERVLPRALPHAVGQISPQDFPDQAFLRHEMVTLSTHAGSHVDAPGHYGPGVSQSPCINDAPLQLFMAPGVLLDATHIDRQVITLADLEQHRASRQLPNVNNKVVLIRTGGTRAIAAPLVEALLDGGAQVIGVDSESFDGPVRPMIEAFLTTRDPRVLWPCHMLGRRRPYYQLERLTNLGRLPTTGFFVLALPIRIEGATAAWTRAIALVPRAEKITTGDSNG